MSELDLLLRHLPHIEQGGLLVLDRFYPSKWLFFLLTAKKIEFCVRMKKDWWKVVERFTNFDINLYHRLFLTLQKYDEFLYICTLNNQIARLIGG